MSDTRSWWDRNWKWVVPVGCLTPVVVCGGILTMIFVVVFGMLRSSEPYTRSLAVVQADPQVRAALGEPIEPGWLFSGEISTSGSSGEADLSYGISGPEGEGTVYVIAEKSAGEWTFQTVAVEIAEADRRIDLTDAVADAPGGSDSQ